MNPPTRAASVFDLLWEAYRRECFICHQPGWCKHREPAVELAILYAGSQRRLERTKAA